METARIRILAALDGSERSVSVINYLGGMIRPQQVKEVVLFHVLDTVPESYWDLARDPAYQSRVAGVKAWAQSRREAMNDRMKGLCRRLMRCGLEPDQVTVKVADRRAGPARDILRESESAYDLVVVGRRGLGAVRGLVLGSVTNKLVTGMSTRPMWVVGKHARPGSVLVALDGSEFSWRGLEHLTQEYIARDRDVWLFTAQRMWDEMSLDNLIVGGPKLNSVLELGRERLEQAGFNPARIHSQLMEEVTSRALAIVEKARREKCDTIIMGRWGVTHNAQFPLGRVTAKVLQLSRGLSVWIVN